MPGLADELDMDTADDIKAEYVAGDITIQEFEDRIEYLFTHGQDPEDVHPGKRVLHELIEQVGQHFAQGRSPDDLHIEVSATQMGVLEAYNNTVNPRFRAREMDLGMMGIPITVSDADDCPRVVVE